MVVDHPPKKTNDLGEIALIAALTILSYVLPLILRFP